MKIIFLIVYIVAVFTASDFYALGVCAATLFFAVLFSKVPLNSVLRSVKGIIILLIFTAVLNLFFYSGETTVVIGNVALQWGIINVTYEGIYFTLFLMVRLFLLVLSSAVLTLTTTPVNLSDGIESLLTPLKWLHFPVRELALIMSIALRFIPALMEETDRIINAQKARGADFEQGGAIQRIKAIVPILIPLLIGAFRRAEELSDAMEARCYSNSKIRTKYKKLTFSWRDGVVLLLGAALLAGVILLHNFVSPIV